METKQPHSKVSLQRGKEILERRKEIESEILEMLEGTESNFGEKDCDDEYTSRLK